MLHRIEVEPEIDRRLRLHAAMTPGRDTRTIILRAIEEYLEAHATEKERAAWGASTVSAFGKRVVEQASHTPRPFRLREVMSELGIPRYGQGLAREAGVALREAGFRDKRMRPPGGKPTQVWVRPEDTGPVDPKNNTPQEPAAAPA